ncbi:polysaccharide pyruvyl transferase family protein [Mycolicibacterium hippocampi]|uniref:polysaccharide pyruvyl transferase family protein n=1 Tax=Mycobacteriaceae TaxID=1762 RepID=UPI0015B5AF58
MWHSSIKARLWQFADTALFRWLEGCWYRTVRPDSDAERRGVLLITTFGGGNIGDQAMFESFLRNTAGPIKVVMPRPCALAVPDDVSSRVEVHVLEGLFQGRPQVTPSRIREFGKLVSHSEALVVIGADILDGAYNLREAWSRTEALRLALRLGTPARIIGFSWSPAPHPVIERAYRRLSGQVALYVRDKYSLDRLTAAGIAARLVPDTVFSLRHRCCCASISSGSPPGSSPVALLNVSGLLRKRHGLSDQYVPIIRELLLLGYKVIMVPHVFREGDDDLAASREVLELVADRSVELVDRVLEPNEVQALAATATLVITGRMHLAILALTMRTPVIVFGSQGKVEGMLALFDLEELVVQTGPSLGAATVERILQLHGMNEKIRAQITQKLPGVVLQSDENFVW